MFILSALEHDHLAHQVLGVQALNRQSVYSRETARALHVFGELHTVCLVMPDAAHSLL